MGRYRATWIWGVAVLVVAAALTWHGRAGETPVYEKAAWRMWQGEMIYRPDDPPAFTYPPFFTLIYVPLLALPASIRVATWNLANAALLAGILAQLWQLVGPWLQAQPGWNSRTRAWLIGLVCLLGLRFLISPLEYRSHDYWVLLSVLLSAGAMARGRLGRAGVWAAAAAACKATPLLLLPMFVWQRRWRAAVSFTVALIALTLLPDLLFPNRAGEPWVVSWYQTFVSKVSVGAAADAPGAWASWNGLNQSLSGTFYRLFTSVPRGEHQWDISLVPLNATQLKLAVLSAELLLLGGFAWSTWPRNSYHNGAAESIHRSDYRSEKTPAQAVAVLEGSSPAAKVPRGQQLDQLQELGSYAIALCCMLLFSPMSSKQHFCALFPALVVSCSYALLGRRNWVAWGALGIIFAVGTLGAKDIIGSAARTQLQAYGAITFCTIAAYLAVAATLVGVRRDLSQLAVAEDSSVSVGNSTGHLSSHLRNPRLKSASVPERHATR